MPFIVPKFIEREPKIIGPFTFKQFLFIGAAGLIGVILYLLVGKTSPVFFIAGVVALAIIALTLAFVKVGGFSLSSLAKNSLKFFLSPRVYFFKKKAMLPKLISEELPQGKEEKEEEPALKLVRGSRLQELSTKLKSGRR